MALDPGLTPFLGTWRGTGRGTLPGMPPFDYAALQAIITSSPFRPLPKDLGSEREGVTVTFFYNIRPGDEGGADN